MRKYVRKELIEKGDPSGCWLWLGSIDREGYGRSCRVEGGIRETYAHRWSWRYHHGPIPDGLDVLHKCDVPRCVNPRHLYLGTHDDNMRDKAERGRIVSSRGEKNGNAKLTSRMVTTIKSALVAGVSSASLARKFNVSKKSVLNIKHGRTWRHV